MKKITILLSLITLNAQAANYVLNLETESYFSDADCNKSVFSNYLENTVNVCQTYNIKLTESEKYDAIYKLIKKQEIQNDWNTFTVVDQITVEDNKLNVTEVFELEENYTYAIQACKNNVCEIVDLNLFSCQEESCEVKNDITLATETRPTICN